jgi:hypothetical protein
MICRNTRCSLFTSVIMPLDALQSATPAWARGRLGHRVISRLAEKWLTPTAMAAIAELLEPGGSPRSSIAKIEQRLIFAAFTPAINAWPPIEAREIPRTVFPC